MDYEDSTGTTTTTHKFEQIKTRSKTRVSTGVNGNTATDLNKITNDIVFKPSTTATTATTSNDLNLIENENTTAAYSDMISSHDDSQQSQQPTQSSSKLQFDNLKELHKIENLNLDIITNYLNNDENKSCSDLYEKLIVDTNKKIDNLNSFIASTSTTTKTTQMQNEKKLDSNNKITCIIHGKRVTIDQCDYNRFIKCGKWCAKSFFEYENKNTEKDCEFCKSKCKTTIDNVYICILCINFALKTFVKHLPYRCKERFNTTDLCEIPHNIKDFSKSKYCRFCYFFIIFNALPRLTRLQKYLIEFKNKEVIFLYSRFTSSNSKKPTDDTVSNCSDDMNYSNIDFNNSSDDVEQDEGIIEESAEQIQVNTSQNKIPNENDECDGVLYNSIADHEYDDFYSNIESSVTPQRTGPRVKHVSRKEPAKLQPYYANENDYYFNSSTTYVYSKTENIYHIKNHLNLQSIENFQLRLSALPESVKNTIIKKYRIKTTSHHHYSKTSFLSSFSNATGLLQDANMSGDEDTDDFLTSIQNKQSSTIKIYGRGADVQHEPPPSATTNHTSKRKLDESINERKKKKFKRMNTLLSSLSSSSGTSLSNLNQHIDGSGFMMNGPSIIVSWDDFFDRYHKISTCQNTRLQQLYLNNRNIDMVTNGPDQQTQEANPTASSGGNGNNDMTNIKSERLKFKNMTQKFFKGNNYDDTNSPLVNASGNMSHANTSNSNNASLNSSSANSSNTNLNSYSNTQAYNNFNNRYNNGSYLLWDMPMDYDILEVWKHGYPVISNKPLCLKSACYICGSIGKDNNTLLYCNVCCEPFHSFCLEDFERPKSNTHILNWVCPACKFCEICGQQNDLLHCNQCENCYHANCFKKLNYPKKPTKNKDIWVCYKCFKCKSCDSPNMNFDLKQYLKMPNYDFNYCFDCDRKITSGEYCKVCQVPFDKGVFDSPHTAKEFILKERILQCGMCHFWLHSKCEYLTTDDYAILINPYYDLNFACHVCDVNAQYKAQLVEYKNQLLISIINDLKMNIQGMVDESVEFETIFEVIENKLNSNEYNGVRSFWNDIEQIGDDRFDNTLIAIIKEQVLELIIEKFKNFDPNEKVTQTQAPTPTAISGHSNSQNNLLNTSFDKNKLLKPTNENGSTSSSLLNNQIFYKIPYDDHCYAMSAASMLISTITSISPGKDKSLSEKCTLKEWSNIVGGEDNRECYLCKGVGDEVRCGRLLSFDIYWIHVNCLLWSHDIDKNEHLIDQIQFTIGRCRNSICKYCRKIGATLTCKFRNCESSFHFSCGKTNGCFVNQENQVFCKEHFQQPSTYSHKQLKKIDDVDSGNHECLLINVDGFRKKYLPAKFNINQIFILIGSMQIIDLGDIDSISDSEEVLYPIDYCCTRVYWSTFEVGKKALYKCKIKQVNMTNKKQHETIINTESLLFNKTFNKIEQQPVFLQTDGNNDDYLMEVEEQKNDKIDNDQIIESQQPHTIPRPDVQQPQPQPQPQSQPQQQSSLSKLLYDTKSHATLLKIFSSSNTPNATTINSLQPLDIHQKLIKLPFDALKLKSNIQIKFDKSSGSVGGMRNEFLHIHTPSPSSASSSMSNEINLNLNTHQTNDQIISPRSDKSDSSLNLDFRQIINNNLPIMAPCYADDDSDFNNSSSLLKKQENPPQLSTILINEHKYNTNLKSQLKQNQNKKNRQNSNNDSALHYYLNTSSTKQAKATPIPTPTAQPTNKAQITKCSRPKVHNATIKELLDNKERLQQQVHQKPSTSSQSISTPQLDESPPSVPILEQPTQHPVIHKQPNHQQQKKPMNETRYLLKEKNDKPQQPEQIPVATPPKPPQPPVTKSKNYMQQKRKNFVTQQNSNINNENENYEKFLFSGVGSSHGSSSNSKQVLNEKDLNDCNLFFEITSDDGFYVQSKSVDEAWRKVTERVNDLRKQNNLKLLSYEGINGLTMYGLNNKTVSYLLEQFDSVQYCKLYKNKYIPKKAENDKWKINVDGCARTSEPFDKNKKRLTDYFHWLTSNQRNDYYFTNRNFDDTFWNARKALLNIEINNSIKFRHLKAFSKRALVVKLSTIHARGLFTLIDIEQGQMIIEYAGEIIRNQICDKREKFYESKGIGCYMFRIDEYDVIDATRKGNQARFINHSCEPNCISKVLVIQGQKHIVIIAQRFIHKSEELTYDYKFPKEDIKIQCLCKSAKCRKYLN